MLSLSQATEQLMSDILRQALAVAYQTAPHNRYSSSFPLRPKQSLL